MGSKLPLKYFPPIIIFLLSAGSKTAVKIFSSHHPDERIRAQLTVDALKVRCQVIFKLRHVPVVVSEGKSARPVVIKSDLSEEGERSEPSELFRFLPTDVQERLEEGERSKPSELLRFAILFLT